MTRTEAAMAHIQMELERRQADLDLKERMRSLTVTVFYDIRGKVCSIDFSSVERTVIG